MHRSLYHESATYVHTTQVYIYIYIYPLNNKYKYNQWSWHAQIGERFEQAHAQPELEDVVGGAREEPLRRHVAAAGDEPPKLQHLPLQRRRRRRHRRLTAECWPAIFSVQSPRRTPTAVRVGTAPALLGC
uniref:Uncharacterized protein n=1 Tax=Ananas comosus var. bracteatus TaxID=296719 RepID=A0A6V7QPU1_ANACO|nr:unnamed protein product [Ananas comosus var. bracteatus]